MICPETTKIQSFARDFSDLSVGEHMERCPRCRAAFLNALREKPSPGHVREDAMEKIASYERQKNLEKRKTLLRYAAAAAAAFALYQGGVFGNVYEKTMAGAQTANEYARRFYENRFEENPYLKIMQNLKINLFGGIQHEK